MTAAEEKSTSPLQEGSSWCATPVVSSVALRRRKEEHQRAAPRQALRLVVHCIVNTLQHT